MTIRRALVDFTSAIGRAMNNSEPYIGRANSHMALGDYKTAVDDFEEAVQLNPQSAQAWTGRGQALERIGDKERALGSYAKGMTADESYGPAREGFNRLGGRAGMTYRLFN